MSIERVVPPLFVPDLVETPAVENIAALARMGGNVPVLKELAGSTLGIRLQINTIQVMDGLQNAIGRAAPSGVYVVSSVIDGSPGDAITFQGKAYQGIRNGDVLPLGPQGDPTAVFTTYLREGRIPRLLSFSLLVVRSNAGLRNLGLVIGKTMQDKRFAQLADTIGDALGAANPAYSIVWQAADQAVSLLGTYLESRPDEQLAYYQANYTNLFDDLGHGVHPPDRPTMQVGKVRLAYQVDVA